MNAPSVSVVVPCRNGGEFIDGLLASLAKQTFRDFEIIIVDDGSSDAETREKLVSLDPDIRVIYQYRLYTAGARNTGILEASAEFILPLDCDDVLEPCFLAETVPLLRAAPPEVGFVFTHMRLVHAVEGVLSRHFDPFDQLFLNQLPYCMLLRRSAWESVGGYDERMRDGNEDWEFNLRLMQHGFRGIELPKPLFVYRVSSGGLLMQRTVLTHGTLWRYIRRKHPGLYRLRTLASLWAKPSTSRRTSLLTAGALLAATWLLPEAWFNRLYYRLFILNRSRRIARGELQAASSAAGSV